jgi:hypothetical protein
MNDLPSAGQDEERRIFQQLLGRYDAPAFVRRVRNLEGALAAILDRCRQQRTEWATMARLRLGQLRDLAGEWRALRPWLLNDAQLDVLAELEATLTPQLRVPLARTSSQRALRHALHELIDSLERLNRRWEKHLAGVDLSAINAQREDYNRYFVLEKECAVRSARVAREGFRPLRPLTPEELRKLLPPLPVPLLAPI